MRDDGGLHGGIGEVRYLGAAAPSVGHSLSNLCRCRTPHPLGRGRTALSGRVLIPARWTCHFMDASSRSRKYRPWGVIPTAQSDGDMVSRVLAPSRWAACSGRGRPGGGRRADSRTAGDYRQLPGEQRHRQRAEVSPDGGSALLDFSGFGPGTWAWVPASVMATRPRSRCPATVGGEQFHRDHRRRRPWRRHHPAASNGRLKPYRIGSQYHAGRKHLSASNAISS